MARKLVCVCNFVPEREIRLAIDKGAADLEDIKHYTSAGTSCGRCHPAIENILAASHSNENSNQLRLF